MITMTEEAIKRATAIAVDEGVTPARLRAKVLGGGCAGFKYDLYFEDREPSEHDEVFEFNGVTLVIDPLSYQYLDGTELEYAKTEVSEGFKFNNPNVTSACGCGSSFNV